MHRERRLSDRADVRLGSRERRRRSDRRRLRSRRKHERERIQGHHRGQLHRGNDHLLRNRKRRVHVGRDGRSHVFESRSVGVCHRCRLRRDDDQVRRRALRRRRLHLHDSGCVDVRARLRGCDDQCDILSRAQGVVGLERVLDDGHRRQRGLESDRDRGRRHSAVARDWRSDRSRRSHVLRRMGHQRLARRLGDRQDREDDHRRRRHGRKLHQWRIGHDCTTRPHELASLVAALAHRSPLRDRSQQHEPMVHANRRELFQTRRSRPRGDDDRRDTHERNRSALLGQLARRNRRRRYRAVRPRDIERQLGQVPRDRARDRGVDRKRVERCSW